MSSPLAFLKPSRTTPQLLSLTHLRFSWLDGEAGLRSRPEPPGLSELDELPLWKNIFILETRWSDLNLDGVGAAAAPDAVVAVVAAEELEVRTDALAEEADIEEVGEGDVSMGVKSSSCCSLRCFEWPVGGRPSQMTDRISAALS